MISIDIPVPGQLDDGTAYLDIETRTVECGATLSDGWILKQRWSAFATAVVSRGKVQIRAGYDEREILSATSENIGCRVVAYAATREFDEMILKGRFTNARRAHEQEPFFPAMVAASDLEWRNMRKEVHAIQEEWERSQDVLGKDVPSIWHTTYDARNLVLVHLLRDVLELVFTDGKCDADVRDWIRLVLSSNAYALEAIGCG